MLRRHSPAIPVNVVRCAPGASSVLPAVPLWQEMIRVRVSNDLEGHRTIVILFTGSLLQAWLRARHRLSSDYAALAFDRLGGSPVWRLRDGRRISQCAFVHVHDRACFGRSPDATNLL